jgi:hypothetical protein
MVAVGQVAVRVAPVVMGVILHLEQAVHLDDPGHLGAHIRPDDGRGQLRVVLRRQFVAQVVHQRGDDDLDVLAVGLGAGRALQRMRQAADLVALQRPVEPLQRSQQPVGQGANVLVLEFVQKQVLLFRAMFHLDEVDGFHESILPVVIRLGGGPNSHTGCAGCLVQYNNPGAGDGPLDGRSMGHTQERPSCV